MIVGVGTDIVNINRVKKIYMKYDQKFVDKILGDSEKEQYYKIKKKSNKKIRINFLAKRFAAKEAIGKALGLGVRSPVTFKSVEILNNDKGKPLSFFHDKLKEHFEKNKFSIHISLSDEKNYAHAIAIIES